MGNNLAGTHIEYIRCWSATNYGSNPFCERFFISKQNVHTFFVHLFVEENFYRKKTYTLFRSQICGRFVLLIFFVHHFSSTIGGPRTGTQGCLFRRVPLLVAIAHVGRRPTWVVIFIYQIPVVSFEHAYIFAHRSVGIAGSIVAAAGAVVPHLQKHTCYDNAFAQLSF